MGLVFLHLKSWSNNNNKSSPTNLVGCGLQSVEGKVLVECFTIFWKAVVTAFGRRPGHNSCRRKKTTKHLINQIQTKKWRDIISIHLYMIIKITIER